MPIHIETPRLVLRQFRDSDLEPFLAYRNDPQVALYQGWEVPYPRQKALEFVCAMKHAVPGTPGEWFQIAVDCKESTEMIGDVVFHIMRSSPDQACIGYTFAPAHWGQGYATEAVRGLLDYLFRELNLHRIVAECDVLNNASYRLLERLGFRREAHFIDSLWFKGRWSSEYHYGMLKREWLLR